jgi:5-methylcytosine-specific restriction endonuclease McrA
MSTAWRNKAGWYSTYVRMRRDYLAHNQAENGGRCALAIEGVCTTTATQVHHVLGIQVSKLDVEYWLPACAPCNNKVGDPARHSPPHVPTGAFDD